MIITNSIHIVNSIYIVRKLKLVFITVVGFLPTNIICLSFSLFCSMQTRSTQRKTRSHPPIKCKICDNWQVNRDNWQKNIGASRWEGGPGQTIWCAENLCTEKKKRWSTGVSRGLARVWWPVQHLGNCFKSMWTTGNCSAGSNFSFTAALIVRGYEMDVQGASLLM